MKKSIYLVSALLVLVLVGLSIREKVQASQKALHANTVQTTQEAVPANTVTKIQPLKGIGKIKSGAVKAVILGDSISVSQGASNPSTTGWNADLTNSLFDKYANKIEWDNKGSSGKLIDYSLQKAAEIPNTTDAVFICSGRIDRNFDTPEQFSEKYTKLINIIKEKAPNADIFCIVEPPSLISADEYKFWDIRKAIINVSEKKDSYLLDLWSAFPKDDVLLSGLLEDVLHPNDQGNKLMSDYIYNRLVAVINNQ
ncbi:lysophospholipase L1-like esterase [Desulfosporosinus orientis DSM 765]|uniref:Lysophospholipase L1-like esterase n=1 Tax=Desulfosporosinus orientis (strain ATCC 19365 / DSM 765 / NCIMB 8382 / VKM B-1628 / Singapore I) TaxID=768706 RepID=G7W6G6_DESOD|nr:SGNH/GDSL hydrolase family protein [Desulfosporosinus orientis]AET68173.1 lysophospholipase L1-like esterase [Desulfosporosinus orientis DSM 765]